MLFPFRSLSLFLCICGVIALAAFTSTSGNEALEGSRKVEYLMETLEGASDYKVRLAAADALGKVADGSVADWMLRAFRKEENPAVRLATLYAVSAIPDHRTLPPLIELAQQELLTDKELQLVEKIFWNFRSAFALSLWMDSSLHSPNRTERAISAWILGIIGDRSVLSVLQVLLQDGSSNVRLRAAQAIGRIGNTSGRSACEKLAKNDREATVRKAAANCVSLIDLTRRGQLPQANNQRVKLNVDLYGLQTASVTPQLYQAYLKKNVNPRDVELAVRTLRPNEAENREDRTVNLITGEELRRFFKINVVLITSYTFRESELNRMRETLREEAGHVNQCYVQAVANNPKLAGDVTVNFRVLRNGVVSTASVDHATLKDAAVQNCILKNIREIRFAVVPTEYVTMKYTFSFVPPRDEKYEFSKK